MSSRLNYLWLTTRAGLGPITIVKLLRHFGTPEAILTADKKALCAACSLNNTQIQSLSDTSMERVEQIAYTCMQKNIRILTIGDRSYPNRLRSIPDPPIVLYIHGRWLDFDNIPGIAVVGTRRATLYGTQIAEEIGRSLAKGGLITVSGMAKGIDKAAHYGALRAGGATIAVLAGGVDVCYPPEHSRLMSDISLAGAIVSEYPPGTEPKGAHYHRRNRILSGLCVATVVVEAKNFRSGSLITAHCALDQGRDVYAVPGGLNMPNSSGCNQLIAEGQATLLYRVDQLVQEYGDLQILNKPRSDLKEISASQNVQKLSPLSDTPTRKQDSTTHPQTPVSSTASTAQPVQELSAPPKPNITARSRTPVSSTAPTAQPVQELSALTKPDITARSKTPVSSTAPTAQPVQELPSPPKPDITARSRTPVFSTASLSKPVQELSALTKPDVTARSRTPVSSTAPTAKPVQELSAPPKPDVTACSRTPVFSTAPTAQPVQELSSPTKPDVTARSRTPVSSTAPTAQPVWESSPPINSAAVSSSSSDLSAERQQVIELVQSGINTIDELSNQSGLSASRVMCLITMLELEGIIKREKNKLILY